MGPAEFDPSIRCPQHGGAEGTGAQLLGGVVFPELVAPPREATRRTMLRPAGEGGGGGGIWNLQEKGKHVIKPTASTIEEAVASLDGVVDDIRGNGVVDLPEAEAHLGHVIAAVELDDG